MPAKKGSSADFQLFGRTIASAYPRALSSRAVFQRARSWSDLCRKGTAITSSTSAMRRATGATHSGASTSICAPGARPRSRASKGCAIRASPIQFGATTRIRGN
jgi:hypothetical protein